MTYGTPHTLDRRPPALGPMPEPACVPLNEAMYAGALLALVLRERAEARGRSPAKAPTAPQAPAPAPEPVRRSYRPGPPPIPADVKILRYLGKHGPMTRTRLANAAKLNARTLTALLSEMRAAGLIHTIPAPLKHCPGHVLLALTHAGLAKMEAAR